MNEINNNEFFSFVKKEINNRDISFTVKGNSMKPFFKDNITIVTLSRVDLIKKRDIILFKLKDKFYLHRVMKINRDTLTCEGDNLLTKEVIKINDVIAKVISYKNKRVIYTKSLIYKARVRMWYLIKFFKRIIKKLI